ncbi:MAG: hypothetical protein ACP5OU_08475 [Methanothrix sp.]
MNELQKDIFKKIKESVCNSMECYPVRHNAIGIATPFLDWMGERAEVYVTEKGVVTDGEQTLNQMRALNSYNEFLKWPHKENYLFNYNITSNGESLDLNYLENPQGILKYIQGIARLPGFFEAKPLGEKQDKFPTLVKNMVRDALVKDYPKRPQDGMVEWAFRLTQPRTIKVRNVSIHSDMSPVDGNKIIEIISHQNSSDPEKKAHVREKLFNPLYLKMDNQEVEPFSILSSLLDYPGDSIDLLSSETTVIELRNPNAITQITKLLAEA